MQVVLADQQPHDGSLAIVPGFHHLARCYFEATSAGQQWPRGGYFPLQEEIHGDIMGEGAAAGTSPAGGGLWRMAKRIPKRWAGLHADLVAAAAGEGSLSAGGDGGCGLGGGSLPRSAKGVTKKLRQLADELDSLGEGEDPKEGDYILWDPRLAHTTGERSDLNWSDGGEMHIRQTFYAAFMIKNGNEAAIAAQRSCRETGSHPPWAPDSHSEVEMDFGEGDGPAELTALGRQLYGYAVPRGERRAAREAAAAGSSPAAASAPQQDELCGAVQCAFFRRYGYVVIERAVPTAMTSALREEIRAEVVSNPDPILT